MTEEEYLKAVDKANIILATEYNETKLDELEELFQIIQVYDEKVSQEDEQSGTVRRRIPYTFEDIKQVWENPKQLTEEEMKNTFIEDDDVEIDFSKLKV